jgi:hypothetical protein
MPALALLLLLLLLLPLLLLVACALYRHQHACQPLLLLEARHQPAQESCTPQQE